MQEIWRNIKDYKGFYQISNLGNVKSLKRYRYIHGEIRIIEKVRNIFPCITNKGYRHLSLYKDKKSRTFDIHRLLAETFIPNPENKPEVNHKDGNKLNNNLNNLEWVTESENRQHAFDTGLQHGPKFKGESHPYHKLTQKQVDSIRHRVKDFTDIKTFKKIMASKFNVTPQCIYRIIKNETWIQ